MRIASIVEGDGEVTALPLLLRRVAVWLTPEVYVEVLPPARVRRDRFLNRPEEFDRHLRLASAKCQSDGWILILLDADDDCPATTGADLIQRAKDIVPHRNISVVLANREFEAWFIAAAASLQGVRNLQCSDEDLAAAPEVPRDAKGWLSRRMGQRRYDPVTDQAAFAQTMDLTQARERSRSFRKLCKEWSTQFGPHQAQHQES